MSKKISYDKNKFEIEYKGNAIVLTRYKGAEVNVTITDGVTKIGKGAFEYCTGLTSIIIPNSVTCIDERVFAGCKGLTSITVPDSVTYIDDNAFIYCKRFTIKCHKGSYAEQYCKENNIPYREI